MIDVTDRTQEIYRTLDRRAEDTSEAFSNDPTAAVTFIKLAAYRSEEISKKPQGFDDIDEALNFQALAACLSRHVGESTNHALQTPAQPDHKLRQIYALQLRDGVNKHQKACLRNGLWRLYYDPEFDRFHARLTKRRRRSALLALDSTAQARLLTNVDGKLSSHSASEDDVYFAFASSAEHLHFVETSTRDAWSSFTQTAGFTSHELKRYVGFLVFLGYSAREVGKDTFYSADFLCRLRQVFAEAFSCADFTDDVMLRLMDLFSLSPKEADNYCLPVPFFRIGDGFLRYDGFLSIMGPAMGLLTVAIRKHESAWNSTLGSTLAYAADTLKASLPKYPHCEIAARRKFKGGDVDLAIYDTINRHLLICEVKTVYDKFRTTHQMHRFEEAKVNLERAVSQLATTQDALTDGRLDVSTIFGRKLPKPYKVDGALLTWLDPIDLTMNTSDEKVLSLNFATFIYLFGQSNGNIPMMIRTIRELRNIWCVAVHRKLDLGQPEIDADLEVQISAFDDYESLEDLGLSAMTLGELHLLQSTGRSKPSTVQNEREFGSYLAETRVQLSTLGYRSP